MSMYHTSRHTDVHASMHVMHCISDFMILIISSCVRKPVVEKMWHCLMLIHENIPRIVYNYIVLQFVVLQINRSRVPTDAT